jgi:hypothetical protein
MVTDSLVSQLVSLKINPVPFQSDIVQETDISINKIFSLNCGQLVRVS